MTFWDILLWFYIYSFVGWFYESMLYTINQKKFVNRGFLNGPYCPIYGSGAILFILATNGIDNIFLRFIAGGAIACVLEYITSYVLEKLFHARWWDYTPRKFNIRGRICLAGFLVFGTFAVLMPWVHHFISGVTFAIPEVWRIIITIAITIGFVIDLYITNTGLVRFNKVLKEYQKAIDRRYLHALEFIRRSRRTFEMRIEGRRKHFENVLSFQQRRTIESFPHFISTRYEDALERLRELNANTRKDNKTQAKTKTKTKKKK